MDTDAKKIEEENMTMIEGKIEGEMNRGVKGGEESVGKGGWRYIIVERRMREEIGDKGREENEG